MIEGIREIRVDSLPELIRAMTPPSPDPESGRRRSYMVYRGMIDADEHLLTSLDRLSTPATPSHVKGYELEEHILRNFIRHARPASPVPHSSDWELLVLAQHHGLPTRLLDWTYSPLVAAHFATLDSDLKSDGVIWRLDCRRVHEHFRIETVALTVDELDDLLRSRGLSSIWDLVRTRTLGQNNFVCLVDAPSLDARLTAHSATLTISSDKTRPLDEMLIEAGLAVSLTRFVLPAAAIDLIRDQLDLCSISEGKLFPDLDGLAAEMRRYYAPSGQRAKPLA